MRANGCRLAVSELPVSSPDTLDGFKGNPRPSTEARKEAAAVPDTTDIAVDNVVAAEPEELDLLPGSPTLHIALPAVELGSPVYHEPAIEQNQQPTERLPALTPLPESPFPQLHEPIQEHKETQPGNTVTPAQTLEDTQGYPTSSPSPNLTFTHSWEAVPKEFETISYSGLEKPDELVPIPVHSEVDQIHDEYVESGITAPTLPSSSEGSKKKSKKARRREAKMKKLFQDISGPSAVVTQTPGISEEQSGVSTIREEHSVQHDPILVPDTTLYINKTVTSLVHERGITEVGLFAGIESSEHMQANDLAE